MQERKYIVFSFIPASWQSWNEPQRDQQIGNCPIKCLSVLSSLTCISHARTWKLLINFCSLLVLREFVFLGHRKKDCFIVEFLDEINSVSIRVSCCLICPGQAWTCTRKDQLGSYFTPELSTPMGSDGHWRGGGGVEVHGSGLDCVGGTMWHEEKQRQVIIQPVISGEVWAGSQIRSRVITTWARHRHKESGSRDNSPGEPRWAISWHLGGLSTRARFYH